VDTYAGGIPLLIACLIEVLMVAYVYGYRRFIGNIEEMMGKPKNLFWKWLGYPVNPYWWVCWIAITPAVLLVSILDIFIEIEKESLKYNVLYCVRRKIEYACTCVHSKEL
jgi:hypothetical protein